MKLLHISDLHLGKRLQEHSLLEDQRHILQQILEIVDAEAPRGVLIAGDVYDKSLPSAEAVSLFDDFLSSLVQRGVAVFVIAGNHDSPERIAFGAQIMAAAGVYVSPLYRGDVRPICLGDEHGPVNFYLLPFLKPAHVRACFPDESIESYTDALRVAIAHMNVEEGERNVLLTHQFVTGASSCDSEVRSVGGSDNVDAEVFAPFDYVALGHIHGPQHISRPTLRYCGTPLKYSFSEIDHKKSVTLVELSEKGSVALRTIPVKPLHELRQLKGSFSDLMKGPSEEGWKQDYLHLTLTDEETVPDAIGRLRTVYSHILKLDYDNTRSRSRDLLQVPDLEQKRSSLEYFEEFFVLRNGRELSPIQRSYVAKRLEEMEADTCDL